MVMAGGAGEGGKGWKQGEKDCFVCMQGCRVGHKENVGLGGKTIKKIRHKKYRTDSGEENNETYVPVIFLLLLCYLDICAF